MGRKVLDIGLLDKMMDWLSHLRKASADRIVLVQNKADADKLSELGVRNLVFYAEPEFKLIERIAESGKECILLFDTDRPSNERAERLRSLLQEHGVKVNTRFRKVLFSTELKDVAGITAYLKKHVCTSERQRLSKTFLR